jgi:hypothetical protein
MPTSDAPASAGLDAAGNEAPLHGRGHQAAPPGAPSGSRAVGEIEVDELDDGELDGEPYGDDPVGALVARDEQCSSERAAGGLPRLFDQKCPTCVFRPGNLMNLCPGRLADLVESNLAQGTALVCHLTTFEQRPELGEVLCRGFVDAYGEQTGSIQVLRRLAIALGLPAPFEIVPVPGTAGAQDEPARDRAGSEDPPERAACPE